MLDASKMKLVEELVTGSQTEELIWLNGYIAGLVAGKKGLEQPALVPVQTKPSVNKITIAFGTETGNSKKLASSFAAKAKKAGINAKIVDLNQYRLNDLQKEEYFITVVSTHGDGEPPAAAKKFFDHIHANGLKLENLLQSSVNKLDSVHHQLSQKLKEMFNKEDALSANLLSPMLNHTSLKIKLRLKSSQISNKSAHSLDH